MKFPDHLNEKLKTHMIDHDLTWDPPVSDGEGNLVVNYFFEKRGFARVTFADTPGGVNEWHRSMTEAMTPGTDAGAGNYQMQD
jgi:hypothetical protein